MDIDHKHPFDGKQDRNFHQKPFDEITDPLPQIDQESAALSEKDSQQKEAETKSEIEEEDNRDQGESSQDWDAENNRSGRRK